jgi:methionine-rich copper-binding protein CopC
MTDENKQTEDKTPQGADAAGAKPAGLTTKRIILILGILVIVCAAAVAAFVLTREKPPETVATRVIDESNLEEINAEIEEKVAKGMFETHMTTTWTFPDGKSPSSDAIMGNSPNNNYPFWFEVSLRGSEEIVYSSSLLPVGSEIAEIVLEKDLDAGTYAALLTIHMVEEDGAEVESNMGFNITLIIEN